MDMNESRIIAAPRARVWEALNDAQVLQQCIPGCESIEVISETEMAARVTLKIGPIRAAFKGMVTLSDIDPPAGYRITGEGTGGSAGHAKGSATVTLQENEEGTQLQYTVEAKVGGKIAQMGARLIDATAKKLAAQFFTRFAAIVEPDQVSDRAISNPGQAAPVPSA